MHTTTQNTTSTTINITPAMRRALASADENGRIWGETATLNRLVRTGLGAFGRNSWTWVITEAGREYVAAHNIVPTPYRKEW